MRVLINTVICSTAFPPDGIDCLPRPSGFAPTFDYWMYWARSSQSVHTREMDNKKGSKHAHSVSTLRLQDKYLISAFF